MRLRWRWKEGVKKVKNKLPGGIDKKIPARFFHQIQLGWTARTGGGGRKPDRTRGGSLTYIYIRGAWMGISSRRRIVWGRAPGGYQLIRNTPACYPRYCRLPRTAAVVKMQPASHLTPTMHHYHHCCSTATVLQQRHDRIVLKHSTYRYRSLQIQYSMLLYA